MLINYSSSENNVDAITFLTMAIQLSVAMYYTDMHACSQAYSVSRALFLYSAYIELCALHRQ